MSSLDREYSCIGPDNLCFLQKLSPEIRSEIWKWLLLNPELGQYLIPDASLTKNKYNLYPSILRTCKTIYKEASIVLYNLNTFYICAFDLDLNRRDENGMVFVSHSPLARYEPGLLDDLAYIPGLAKIQKLIIVRPSTYRIAIVNEAEEIDEETSPKPDGWADFFHRLSRTLALSPPRHLEIHVLPIRYSVRYVPPTNFIFIKIDPGKTAIVLSCLAYLRHVQSFSVCESSWLPTLTKPEQECLPKLPVLEYSIPPNSVIDHIATIIKGTDKVELAWGIYYRVLKYAQAFERNPIFARDMDKPPFHPRDFFFANKTTYATTDLETYKLYLHSIWNPFLFGVSGEERIPFHPIERALASGKLLITLLDRNDVDSLKRVRNTVVQYLEPQYQSIISAAEDMDRYMRAELRIRTLLRSSISTRNHTPKCDIPVDRLRELMGPLQAYESVLQRWLPDPTRGRDMPFGEFEAGNNRVKEYYATFARESVMGELRRAVKGGEQGEFREMVEWVVEDMHCQTRRIVGAREELYKGDKEVVGGKLLTAASEIEQAEVESMSSDDDDESKFDLDDWEPEGDDGSDDDESDNDGFNDEPESDD